MNLSSQGLAVVESELMPNPALSLQESVFTRASCEFSMAVVQANYLLEDHSQLESGPISSFESGPYGIFVGIYDGHIVLAVGRHALRATYPCSNRENERVAWHMHVPTHRSPCPPGDLPSLGFPRIPSHSSLGCPRITRSDGLGRMASDALGWPRSDGLGCPACWDSIISKVTTENHGMSADVINKAFLATEEEFFALVRQQWEIKLQLASVDWRKPLMRSKQFSCDPSTMQVLNLFGRSYDRYILRSLQAEPAISQGIARRLVEAALHEAAKKREMRYSDLKKIDRGVSLVSIQGGGGAGGVSGSSKY
ncbi:putative protein phosphatase 2C 38 [Hibiscus syriacus]|uniref:Uncharacterized protein n=1 Tax=Hibiscus syriacus TaxID=106335 RepID=A0A6A3C559_HIBSY|nr:putative protein phosphatase 2C 38 [Hibiscus syriacus]